MGSREARAKADLAYAKFMYEIARLIKSFRLSFVEVGRTKAERYNQYFKMAFISYMFTMAIIVILFGIMGR